MNMLTDSEIGAVTGKGFYYHWGPNFTADPIVIAGKENRKVLLIKRGDTGKWALPGGFVDKDERPVDAARREAGEEAGIVIGEPSAKIYSGVVTDLRTTIHAWAETSAYIFNVDEAQPLIAGDDAKDAAWFDENNLPNNLHGSHAELISRSLDHDRQNSLRDILNQPTDSLTITEAMGGHMAYGHTLISSTDDHLFIKSYDPAQFTDKVRMEHSLAYLKKEHMYLLHLKASGYSRIPSRFDFIDGTALVMDALLPEHGWHWRTPTEASLEQRYINEVLEALRNLNDIPAPDSECENGICPTLQTLEQEGWQSVNETNKPRIKERVMALSQHFDKPLREATLDMLSSIDKLQQTFGSRVSVKELVLSHNDARQSNIAWHPELGVKIVDWSWGDPAPQGADSTMFLIDLAKSGVDVSQHLEHFNQDHAITLIGWWLAHSLWATHGGKDTVRMQQAASAVTAYQLLKTQPAK
jgi:ADP-ribose pyrophosphatase YjhB (NUDIX family)